MTSTESGTTANPDPYALLMLLALTYRGKHVYMGTADPESVAKRRESNKRARQARRLHRERRR